ncbi:MAG: hypothetical protein FWD61_17765 [Phycisphaerales bacterium]|nr:hypothetical protein [Phycisphaerales bacterium]
MTTPPPKPSPPPPERWTLTVEAAGAGPPLVIRVRKLLKAAWRCYGLRCTAAVDHSTAPPNPPNQQHQNIK